MSIPFSRYVSITSGVGGTGGARERDLISRIFTQNTLVPTGSALEFSSADAVRTYFGSSSDEYLRAAFYFGWVSKAITRAKKIAFARWNDAAVAPLIYGDTTAKTLATYTAVSSGKLNITMGAYTTELTGINLSAAVSLAGVASAMQTVIRAYTTGGALFTSATVVYNATRASFDLVGGATGAAAISINAVSSGTDLGTLLGWRTAGETILSDGAAAVEPVDAVADLAAVDNNFASFLFNETLTDAQILAIAEWNDTQNNMYMYLKAAATSTQAGVDYAALADISGVGVTLEDATGYAEMVPGIILAATDYTRRSASQNYMFQTFDLDALVTTEAAANTLDGYRCNYYGQTQQAGQNLSFYQRGILMGGLNDAVDMNVYANEIWLKDAAGVAIINLLLALTQVSANTEGRSQIMAILQDVIDRAIFNGVIIAGKTLTTLQKIYINELTGDDLAWHQVQSIGWWLDCVIESYVNAQTQLTEYKATYTLVYSKADAIRFVSGTHVLI